MLRSFQCRLIFYVALINDMRSVALSNLQLDQIRKTVIDGKGAFIITITMGDIDGTCKHSRGSMKHVRQVPK